MFVLIMLTGVFAVNVPVKAGNSLPDMAQQTPPDDEDPLQSTSSANPPAWIKNYSENPAGVARQTYTIADMPAYLWTHGCGPTAVGMVLGYWDQQPGYDWLLPGDAGDFSANPQIADAIASPEHQDDYSQPFDYAPGPLEPDKSELPLGDEHDNNSIADFMGTSFSVMGNYYGWSYLTDLRDTFETYINYRQPQPYQVTTQNLMMSTGELTWDKFIQELYANRPVVLLVDSDADGGSDHFITAFGFFQDDIDGRQYYIAYNTWTQSTQIYRFTQAEAGIPFGIVAATFFNMFKIESQIYLPTVIKRNYGDLTLSGMVTDNGVPVAGSTVKLLLSEGSGVGRGGGASIVYDSTTTDENGFYQFSMVVNPVGEESLQVIWENQTYDVTRVASWNCNPITATTLSPEALICNFNVHTVDLLTPLHNASVALPVTFTWGGRNTSVDRYLVHFSNYSGGYFSQDAGSSETLTWSSLPEGFITDEAILWWVGILGENGMGYIYTQSSFTVTP